MWGAPGVSQNPGRGERRGQRPAALDSSHPLWGPHGWRWEQAMYLILQTEPLRLRVVECLNPRPADRSRRSPPPPPTRVKLSLTSRPLHLLLVLPGKPFYLVSLSLGLGGGGCLPPPSC